jgi:Zn-dependent peptidase ImmA (M78 family)/DNA-binding XRE family transcriptional regulator
MSADAIASNLRRLRVERGLTQAELAGSAALSRVGYRNIESGQSLPRVETLRSLAVALNVGLQELVSPVAQLRQVRFRALKRLTTREQILVRVSRWLSDFNELEGLVDGIKKIDLIGLRRQNPVGTAAAVRKAFDIGPEEAIRDICGLLESKGIKVLSLELASGDFFGLSVGPDEGGPGVVVNTWERISVERWIFTAAHELGHLVLHPGDYNVSELIEKASQEQEANLFAAHFLMPERSFDKEWEETAGLPLVDRVLKVKRIFRVSYKTVLYRLQERVGGELNVWQMFQNEYKRRSGRTLLKEEEPAALAKDAYRASFPESSRAGEPDDLSPNDFQGDRLSLLVRRGIEKGSVTLSRGAEILGVPLKEIRSRAATWLGSL